VLTVLTEHGTVCRYQRRALCWMLWRELGDPVDQELTVDRLGLTVTAGSMSQTPQLQAAGRPGVQVGASSSSSRRGLVGQPVLASVLTEVQPTVMGVDLLSPLWECIQFGSSMTSSSSCHAMQPSQQPSAAAAVAAGGSAVGCGCGGVQCTGGHEPPHTESSATPAAYYSPLLGRVTQEVPPGCDWCRGGILAEEMGECVGPTPC
jgi:hypothetical protein